MRCIPMGELYERLSSAKIITVVKRPPSPGDTHDASRQARTSSQHGNRRLLASKPWMVSCSFVAAEGVAISSLISPCNPGETGPARPVGGATFQIEWA